jgi:hypothetical protein
MRPAIRDLLRSVLLGFLPYPDLLRRHRIRAASRLLVRCDPWPGDEATPLQLTELCLLHALWLQRATHRAAILRQPEAAALLARGAVETCLLGLYCQVDDDPMSQLRGSNSFAFGSLMKYLVDLDAIPPNVVAIAQRVIGDPTVRTPNTFKMAKAVSEASGNSLALDLYRRLYQPLSTLFAHANGLVLLRHVRKGAHLRERPSYPWVCSSAVRICDASVGFLAWAVSERSDLPTKVFADYANAHMRRSLAPIFVMGLRSAGGSMRWRKLPGAVQALLAGARYVHSKAFKIDPPEARLQQVRAHLEGIFALVDPSEVPSEMDEIVDAFAEVIASLEPAPVAT